VWLRRLLGGAAPRQNAVAAHQHTDLVGPDAVPSSGAAAEEATSLGHSTIQAASRTATFAEPVHEVSDVDPAVLELQQLRAEGLWTDDQIRVILRARIRRDEEAAEIERLRKDLEWR